MKVFVAHKSTNDFVGGNSKIISVSNNIADALFSIVDAMRENEGDFYEFERESNDINDTIEDFIRGHSVDLYHWSFDTYDEGDIRDYYITEMEMSE